VKGIILSGGKGTRLSPLTQIVSKQLLPVYSKPMIHYPLATLIGCGIKDICIISDAVTLPLLEAHLRDGRHLGINLSYILQPSPDGIAQAYVLAESFIGNDTVALILGDNIFHGGNTKALITAAVERTIIDGGASCLGYYVNDPERYGVIKFDDNMHPQDIVEKPTTYVSNYAVPGIYITDSKAISYAKSQDVSARGEYEITDILKSYLLDKKLSVYVPQEMAWFDAGTIDSLHEAASYIRAIERRQGIPVGSPEYESFKKLFIDEQSYISSLSSFAKSEYGQLLRSAVRGLRISLGNP